MASLDINSTARDVMDQFKSHAIGKTFVITGPSAGGLGASAARGLALGSPKNLILVGRSNSKIQPVIDEIKAIDASIGAHFVQADLLDNLSVRGAADEIKKITSEVNGLINCAGIMAVRNFTKSKDGIESQFAANHVGHFLLTNLLMPEIEKAQGVVANVTSRGYHVGGGMDVEDTNFQDGKTYNQWLAYAQSKTANILFSVSLAKKMAKFGGAAFSVNPGYVGETALQKNSGVMPEDFVGAFKLAAERSNGVPPSPLAEVSIEQGAATMVLSVLDPTLRIKSSGSYLEECRIDSVDAFATDPETAEKLWHLSEKLVGQEFAL